MKFKPGDILVPLEGDWPVLELMVCKVYKASSDIIIMQGSSNYNLFIVGEMYSFRRLDKLYKKTRTATALERIIWGID